ncbi:hypothetical protein PVAND_005118 [Polypedilum vanderplanki]|uniref:Peptidase S1 domain-containing protein n=1 Tax=Polypedilum vanderplanki TaxID=319348 RepID=A0A9J6BZM6_POLVA|nr:hypothetical protein PVAND_005118 [Polypedilum vanderplanki]
MIGKFLIFIFLILVLQIVVCLNFDLKQNEDIENKIENEIRNENDKIERKVIGGTLASLGQFPYSAVLRLGYTNGSIGFNCGGTLVKYNWVLSSASCIDGYDDVSVYFGILYLYDEANALMSQDVPHKHRFIHPSYNNFTNNIGLLFLKLATRALLNHPHIDILELPTHEEAKMNLVGWTGIFSGYGSTFDYVHDDYIYGYLHFVSLPIVNNINCQITFPNYTTLKTVCTDSIDNRAPCYGDVGNGLSIELANGRKILVGIFSFYTKYCMVDTPSFFEGIFDHLNWIEETFKNSSPIVGLSFTLLIISIVYILK